MAKQRNYSTEFKRQVVLEYLAGETLYGLSKRHPGRSWVRQRHARRNRGLSVTLGITR